MSLNPCFSLGNNPLFILLRNKLPTKLHCHNISFWYCIDNSLSLLVKKTSNSKSPSLKVLMKRFITAALKETKVTENRSNNVSTSRIDGWSQFFVTDFIFPLSTGLFSEISGRISTTPEWIFVGKYPVDVLRLFSTSPNTGFLMSQMNKKWQYWVKCNQTSTLHLFANDSFQSKGIHWEFSSVMFPGRWTFQIHTNNYCSVTWNIAWELKFPCLESQIPSIPDEGIHRRLAHLVLYIAEWCWKLGKFICNLYS